jgi:hypothetical protein
LYVLELEANAALSGAYRAVSVSLPTPKPSVATSKLATPQIVGALPTTDAPMENVTVPVGT